MPTLRSENSGLRIAEQVEMRKSRAAISPNPVMAVHRREINPDYIQRVYKLSWPNASRGVRDEILHYYGLSNEGVTTLTFTPVGDVDANAVEVHMSPPKIEEISINQYKISLELEVD